MVDFALPLMPMVFLLLLQDFVAGQSTSSVNSFEGYYIAGTATAKINCATGSTFISSGTWAACCAPSDTKCGFGTTCIGNTIYYDQVNQTFACGTRNCYTMSLFSTSPQAGQPIKNIFCDVDWQANTIYLSLSSSASASASPAAASSPSTPTPTSISTVSPTAGSTSTMSPSSGLSLGTKIGLGVGIGVGAIGVLMIIGACVWARRSRRGGHTQAVPETPQPEKNVVTTPILHGASPKAELDTYDSWRPTETQGGGAWGRHNAELE